MSSEEPLPVDRMTLEPLGASVVTVTDVLNGALGELTRSPVGAGTPLSSVLEGTEITQVGGTGPIGPEESLLRDVLSLVAELVASLVPGGALVSVVALELSVSVVTPPPPVSLEGALVVGSVADVSVGVGSDDPTSVGRSVAAVSVAAVSDTIVSVTAVSVAAVSLATVVSLVSMRRVESLVAITPVAVSPSVSVDGWSLVGISVSPVVSQVGALVGPTLTVAAVDVSPVSDEGSLMSDVVPDPPPMSDDDSLLAVVSVEAECVDDSLVDSVSVAAVSVAAVSVTAVSVTAVSVAAASGA